MVKNGFFEPHTSSIDFCEENYVYTPYCVEIWNSLSSLSIIAFAYIGLTQTVEIKKGQYYEALFHREPDEIPSKTNLTLHQQIRMFPRFFIGWTNLAFVGAGSFLFHGTLLRWAQACDEIPMVIGNLVMLFGLLCCRNMCMSSVTWNEMVRKYRAIYATEVQVNGRREKIMKFPTSLISESLDVEYELCKTQYKFRSVVLCSIGIFQVSLYFLFENYLVFFILYGIGVLVQIYIVFAKAKALMVWESNIITFSTLLRDGLLFYISGAMLWFCEIFFCSSVERFHFHIFWHFFAGWGTTLLILAAATFYIDGFGIMMEDLTFNSFGVPKLTFTF